MVHSRLDFIGASSAQSCYFCRCALESPRSQCLSSCIHDETSHFGKNLNRSLADITGIKEEHLDGWDLARFASIACRMSWAAHRQTTRVEDIAYCLLGIFDVNMPLLYGEGQKAFVRLQEEIIRKSSDQSIFAWHEKGSKNVAAGFLARHPGLFESTSNVVPCKMAEGTRRQYMITNLGLKLSVKVVRTFHLRWSESDEVQEVAVFHLSCNRVLSSSFESDECPQAPYSLELPLIAAWRNHGEQDADELRWSRFDFTEEEHFSVRVRPFSSFLVPGKPGAHDSSKVVKMYLQL